MYALITNNVSKFILLKGKTHPTKRALDGWVRCGFSDIFLPSKFFLPVERVSASPPQRR